MARMMRDVIWLYWPGQDGERLIVCSKETQHWGDGWLQEGKREESLVSENFPELDDAQG